MIESIFDIIGLDYSALTISDDTLLICGVIVLVLLMHWVFQIIYLVASTLAKRR